MEHKKPVLTPNFSTDYSALVNRVATLERVIRTLTSNSIVSSLPNNPINGEEINYQNEEMEKSGVAWRFRYRENSSSAHKWEFVGGGAFYGTGAGGNKVVVANTWTDLGGSPSVTVPLAGDYDTVFDTAVAESGAVNGTVIVGLSVGGAEPAAETRKGTTLVNVAFAESGLSRKWPVTFAAKNVLSLRYRVNENETLYAGYATLAITPIRVS